MLSKTDFALTIDLINQCLMMRTRDDLAGFYRYLAAKLGIDFLIVGHIKDRFDTAESHYFGLESWKDHYDDHNLIAVDPVIPFTFNAPKAVLWSDAYQQVSCEKSKAFVNQTQDFDLADGMSYGNLKHSITSTSNIASVGIKSKALSIPQSLILEQVLPHLTEVLARPSIWRRHLLTAKESEVIKWVAEGKSYWETGIIMGISERTIKFHMKNICQKLDVTNKSQAVARCLSLGMMPL